MLIKMALKNIKSEIKDISESLKTYGDAKQFVFADSPDVIKACRESITAAHSANAAIP